MYNIIFYHALSLYLFNLIIYSTRTSCRSARKQQRKMWNLKKGNFREEPTLVLTLKQTIEKLDKFKGNFVLESLELYITYTFVFIL